MQGHVLRRGPASATGSPRKRPWGFVLEVGTGPSGARRQVYRSGFATKRDAQDALQAEIKRRSEGVTVDVRRLTAEEFLSQRWLPGLSRIRPSTLRSYSQHVRGHIVPLLGQRQLRNLSTQDVNELISLLVRPRDLGGRGLSPVTVKLVHATLHAALADAVRWGLLPNNVATGAELPRRSRSEIAVWSAGELREFLARVADDELGTLYTLIANTGLRRGEATGLRWRQADLAAKQLLIDHQLVDNGYTDVLSGEPKSRRGRRVIAIDATTSALLGKHQAQQRSRLRANGITAAPEYVFTRTDGSPHHPEFVSRHFQVLVRASGLPRIRLHDLRHTHATLGLAAGVPAKVMADRLGHSTVLLTLDTYSHVSPALDAGAAALIAGLIAGPTPPPPGPP